MPERIVEYVEVSRKDKAGHWQPWICVLVDQWIHGAFFVRLPLVLTQEPYLWQYRMTRYYVEQK